MSDSVLRKRGVLRWHGDPAPILRPKYLKTGGGYNNHATCNANVNFSGVLILTTEIMIQSSPLTKLVHLNMIMQTHFDRLVLRTMFCVRDDQVLRQ